MRKSYLPALAGLALAFLAIGLWKNFPQDEALDEEERASVPRPELPEFWGLFQQAADLRSKGRFLEAAKLYEKALQIRPDHEESLYYYGNCLIETGDSVQAAAVFRQITELNPRSLRGFSQLGVTLSTPVPGASLDLEAAREAIEKTLEFTPEESGPFLRLGQIALEQNRLEEAARHFDTAARFQAPEGIFWRGYLHFQQQEYEKAARRFHQLLELAAADARIAGKGAVSEGDSADSGKAPSSPLQSASAKARIYLFWTAARLGGYPGWVSKEFRLEPPVGDSYTQQKVVRSSRPPAGPDNRLRGRPRWVDYDNDGDPDLMVAFSDHLELFQNRRGNLINVSRETGLGQTAGAWDSCWGDVNRDGRPDLYLIRSGWMGSGQNALFFNQPSFEQAAADFVEATGEAGLQGVRATAAAGFYDLDQDGDLDLVEAGNRVDRPSLRLLLNSGQGDFSAAGPGVFPEFAGNVVDIALADIEADGDLDLLVLRWGLPALLLEGDGKGSFRDSTPASGLEEVGGDGFSTLFFDYNRDRLPDLLVTGRASYDAALSRLLEPQGTVSENSLRLFQNVGKGRFLEVTRSVGLSGALGVTQVVAGDFNGDGWIDLLVACGGLELSRLEPSRIFFNQRGKSFRMGPLVPGLEEPVNALGAAAADADGDGRWEIYLSPGGLFRLIVAT